LILEEISNLTFLKKGQSIWPFFILRTPLYINVIFLFISSKMLILISPREVKP